MVSCLLPSSSLPNQGWPIRKEEEEEAGMVLLVPAIVKQNGFKVSGSCKCLRLLDLGSSSKDSLDQYCPTEILCGPRMGASNVILNFLVVTY